MLMTDILHIAAQSLILWAGVMALLSMAETLLDRQS